MQRSCMLHYALHADRFVSQCILCSFAVTLSDASNEAESRRRTSVLSPVETTLAYSPALCRGTLTSQLTIDVRLCSDHPCYQGLTPGQVTRMLWAWATFRSPVKSPAPQQQEVTFDVAPSPPPPPSKRSPPPRRSPPPPPRRSPPPLKVSKPAPKPAPKPVPKPTKRAVLQPKKTSGAASAAKKRTSAAQQKRVAAANAAQKTVVKVAGKSKPKPKPTAKRSRKPVRRLSGCFDLRVG